MIDYEEIANYLLAKLRIIQNYQFSIEYCDKASYATVDCDSITNEIKEKAKKDSSCSYASFDRAKDRVLDVKRMIEFKDDDDFKYYAINNLVNAHSRIEHFLESALLEYPKEAYNIDKYNDILYDDENRKDDNNAFWKYYYILYRRTMINLGLVDSIKDVRGAIKESKDIEDKDAQYEILNKIEELAKQLNGYKENYGGN